MITKENLQACDWKNATHIIKANGNIVDLYGYDGSRYWIGDVRIEQDHLFMLGFTPYKLRKEYTFQEALKEPGLYLNTTTNFAMLVGSTYFELGYIDEFNKFNKTEHKFGKHRLTIGYQKIG
jgi:hypothetical protein